MNRHATRTTKALFAGLLLICALLLQALPAFAQSSGDVSADDFVAQLIDLRDNDPTYSDSFRTDNADWETDLESTDSSLRIEGRTYHVDAVDPNLFVWGMSPVEASNFYVEVYVDRVAGPLNNEFGIVFRHVDADNFYAFMASSDGYYILRAMVDGEWSEIIPWTASDAVDQSDGASNLVGVYANGATLVLLINDTVVNQIDDESFSAGGIALSAGSFDEGGVEIAFDDIALWDIDEFGALNTPTLPASDEPTVEPTDEPLDEPTLEPTLEPSVEPTAEPATLSDEDAAAIHDSVNTVREQSATLSETFSRDSGAWELGDDGSSNIEITRRSLKMNIIEANWLGWSTLQDVQAANLLIEADFSLDSGAPVTESGIIFRYQDENNLYYFAISGDGSFSLWKLVDDQWEELLPWAATDALDATEAAVNRLSVLAEGNTISLLINDEVVGQAQDDTFAAGLVGLAVGTFEEGDVVVLVDNVDLWVLSEEPTVGPTPEPEVTPELEITPEPEVTPQSDLPPAKDDALARVDAVRASQPTTTSDFRRDDGTWSIDAEEDVTHAYTRRAFHITVDRDDWVSWTRNQEIQASDFFAEVDAAYIAGPIGAEFGMAFRYVDDNNLYLYVTSGDGYFSLFKRQDGQWETLAPWTQSEVLNVGTAALNRLGVLAEGASITLFANNTPLTTVEDDSFATGQIGLAAGTFTEPGLEVSFDNFSYWEIDEGQ